MQIIENYFLNLILDPSNQDNPFIKSLMGKNEDINISFYINESRKFFINLRNRVFNAVSVEKAEKADKDYIEENGIIVYLNEMNGLVRELLSEENIENEYYYGVKVDRKLGIVIPKWIDLTEDYRKVNFRKV